MNNKVWNVTIIGDYHYMTALAIYNEFESVEALTNIDLHELNDFITEKGKNLFSDPDEIAKAIQKATRLILSGSRFLNILSARNCFLTCKM